MSFDSRETEAVETTRETPVNSYTDGSQYEIPRPFLTITQAASILGKSLRAIERSIIGRFGNKLPEGWNARKIKTDKGDEWRIIPPPGFRVKQFTQSSTTTNNTSEDELVLSDGEIENMLKTQKMPWRMENHSIEHPSIVIDRSEEVEYLLRELVGTQKALSEERRLHMEDLRLITQLQGSMRLLEINANEQSKIKSELELAKDELKQLKQNYTELLNLPWWKRIFKKAQ
jgi:hypothetical protein